MSNIYLVRHGQKEERSGDPGLTPVGIEQAIQTGNFFKDIKLDKMVVSPFKRTRETARHIASVIDLDFEVNENLVERMEWRGGNVSRGQFLREWIKATNDRDYVPKHGDSSRKKGTRVDQLIQHISPNFSNVLLVTHGGAILDYLRNTFGDERIGVLRKRYAEGSDFQLFNCSITKVSLTQNPSIELLNYVDHLEQTSE